MFLWGVGEGTTHKLTYPSQLDFLFNIVYVSRAFYNTITPPHPHTVVWTCSTTRSSATRLDSTLSCVPTDDRTWYQVPGSFVLVPTPLRFEAC